MDNILELERKLNPFGTLVLLGAGRLGGRFLSRAVQVHRGGFREILLFDGGTVEENDYFHVQLGAEPGENKALFFERLYSVSGYREVKGFPYNFTEEHLKVLEKAAVVVSTVAGGDTLPLIKRIGQFTAENGIPFITTNGVFGFGDEEIRIFEGIENVTVGPALFLKEMGFPEAENVVFVGTGKLIRDGLPITPVILDRVADVILTVSLKKLYGRRDEGADKSRF